VIKKLKHDKIPNTVQYEVTYSCNSNCIFCYNPNRGKIIDKFTTNKIIDILSNSNIYHIQLTGGELSLVPKINEYIEELSKNHVVTIVTNGLKKIENINENLGAVFVSLHGLEDTHEYLTNNKATYGIIVDTIKHYVSMGLDVYTDTILTAKNYAEIYNIVSFAKAIGVKKCFVNRFEVGGIGSKEVQNLMPNLDQFKTGITQMIDAKNDFGIEVGFCTSIPFCIDSRLSNEGLDVSCGIGTTFGVVNPIGDLRICNQSNRIYGNILEESFEQIWAKRTLDEYRCLNWVDEPCKNCVLLEKCVAGCRVDNVFNSEYCIDYYMRHYITPDDIRAKNISHYVEAKQNDSVAPQDFDVKNKQFVLNADVVIDKESNTVKNKFTLINTDELGVQILMQLKMQAIGVHSLSDVLTEELDFPQVDCQEIQDFIYLMLKHGIVSVLPQ